jgi:hypothetical protein
MVTHNMLLLTAKTVKLVQSGIFFSIKILCSLPEICENIVNFFCSSIFSPSEIPKTTGAFPQNGWTLASVLGGGDVFFSFC